MEETLDGRLLKLNKSYRDHVKKAKGWPVGKLYDWIERVVADDPNDEQQHERVQLAAQEAMTLVDKHLKIMKKLSVCDAKEDILRLLVLHMHNLLTASFSTSAAKYLAKSLMLSSNPSVKSLIYMSLGVIGCTIPEDEDIMFYQTVIQDIDKCNMHVLRWISNNTTSRIPLTSVETMIVSLQNLLFRSVASVSVLELAATGLLNLRGKHGEVKALSSEQNRWDLACYDDM